MKNKMLLLIILSLILGIVCGIMQPQAMLTISWIGQLFINLLKLIVLPLIFSALVSAIASIGGMKRLSTIGVCTIGYVLLSVAVAVCIGLFLLNFFKPGVGMSHALISANASPADLKPIPFPSYLLSMFPPNIVAAAARYEIMPIVFFSIVFAIACISQLSRWLDFLLGFVMY
jgi:Na+/H+-dicarboxylate symporter